MKKYSFLFILLTFWGVANAQQNAQQNPQQQTQQNDSARIVVAQTPPLSMMAKNYGDSVVLMWHSGNAALWQQHQANGFILERKEIKEGAKPVRLTTNPIKAWMPEEFKSRLDSKDKALLLAAQALYGSFNDPSTTKAPIFAQAEAESERFFVASMAVTGSKAAATAMGQRFVDKTFEKGKTYLYTLTSDTNTTQIFVFTDEKTVFKTIAITATSGDSTVRVQFDGEMFQPIYPFYSVERSADKGKTWEVRTKNKVLTNMLPNKEGEFTKLVVYNDSLPRNYWAYQYRIIGYDNFSDVAEASNVEEAFGRDLQPPPAPWMDKVEVTDDNKLRVTWKNPDVVRDLLGFKIVRSNGTDSTFTAISDVLPLDARSFVDKNPIPEGLNFYKIVALDTAGNVSNSYPFGNQIMDSIPPSVPTSLTGTIDTMGIVRLNWEGVSDKDVMGYKIFSSNYPDREFFALTKLPLETPQYQDTISLEMLNHKIYYKVLALDKNYNHSEQSPAIRLLKPVKIPPSAPVLNNYEADAGKVTIEWANSISESLTETRVLRSDDGKNWTSLKTIEATDEKPRPALGKYEDAPTEVGKSYYYTIEAVNSGGKTARATPILIEVEDKRPKPTIQKPEAQLTDKGIQLSWAYSVEKKHFIRIYRSINGSDFARLRDLEPATAQFIDELDGQTGVIKYTFKAFFDDGSESPYSNNVTVKVAEVKE